MDVKTVERDVATLKARIDTMRDQVLLAGLLGLRADFERGAMLRLEREYARITQRPA